VSRLRGIRKWLLLSSAIAGGIGFGGGCSSSNGVGSDAGTDGTPDGNSGKPDTGKPDGSKPDSGKPGKDSGSDVVTPPNDTGVDTGTDASTVLTLVALTPPSSFAAIFDAVPSPDGTTVYVTGADATGNVGVFSVSTSGGPTAPTTVSAGGTTPWVAPFGIAISSDGNTLYVADTGADVGTPPSDSGGIFSLATTAGTPALIAGSTGVYPRGITVETSGSADTLFFTGSLSGIATVFSTPTAGGTPTKIANGAIDPSGIAADSSGNLYVVDTTGGPGGIASVLKVAMGASTTSVLLAGTYVGYPAGIAVDSAGNVILSGLTAPNGNDVLSSISSAGAATPFLTDAASLTALGKLTGAAGLHKASAANVYAFVDSAGLPSDAVYAIK
jgi:hypothetical protein